MDIFSNKENAFVHLNSTFISTGEIKVYRYYSTTGAVESFVVIGVDDGIGPAYYQILSKRKNLVAIISRTLPDAAELILGQTYICPVDGVYHMIYLENNHRVDIEINSTDVYYIEDFETSFMYYVDRYTCKKIDDYFSKVYIDFSNTQAVYGGGNEYPETSVTVWKDNSDITGLCDITIESIGCQAIYDSSKIIRLVRMMSDTAKVVVSAKYRNNTYTETWNISKLPEGIKGADAEIYTIVSSSSFIREPDLISTNLQVMYKSGDDLSFLEVPDLVNYGLHLTFEYSNGTHGNIWDTTYNFEPRISGDTEITYCIIRLLNDDSEVIHSVTLPYLPNTSTISNGQGIYKATIFHRGNGQPDKPLGGSWDNPIPVTSGWSQTIPDGTEVIWASTRIFTSNGKSPQDLEWSYPTRISNTENLEVQYSSCPDASIVGTPNTNPENWSSIAVGLSCFMATRTITNGIPGLWQVFAIRGKDGKSGNYREFIYKNCINKPEIPEGPDPDGWADYPGSDGTWWMSSAEFSGETGEMITTWSNPIKVSGSDGRAGLDGPYTVYQYAVGTGILDAPEYGWSSIVPTIPKGYYLWQRSGVVYPPATIPESWGTPFRITGEKGEQGDPGSSINLDLTNEVSSVAADYYGNIVAGAVFESTRILLYDNGIKVNISSVKSISLREDGVKASIDTDGTVNIIKWTAPEGVDLATVTITVNYKGTDYTTVYSIHKVKAGKPGEDAILYSIIPDSSVMKKINGKIIPEILKVSVRRSQGNIITDLGDNIAGYGLELSYSYNNSTESLPYVDGIRPGQEIDYIVIYLKNSETGGLIDKETVVILESSIDLTVDLTNEASTIAANEDGTLIDGTFFETSRLTVFYGNKSISPINCLVSCVWKNLRGIYHEDTGIIEPTGWDSEKLGETNGSATLTVSYEDFTKEVTYSVTKLNSGKSTVIYSILPSSSAIKASDISDYLSLSVLKHIGNSCSVVENWSREGLIVEYTIGSEESGSRNWPNETYSLEIGPTNIDQIKVYLYKRIENSKSLIDQESIPVIHDGTNAHAITVDLTNEASSVAANYDGYVLTGGSTTKSLEKTSVSVYEDGKPIADKSRVSIRLEPSEGCSVEKSEWEIFPSWIDTGHELNSVSVKIIVTVDGISYNRIYGITKIKAGKPGESATIYSVIPSLNIIRRLNGVLQNDTIYATIKKTIGSSSWNVLSGGEDGVYLYYTIYYKNGNISSEQLYPGDGGIGLRDNTIRQILFTLKKGDTILDKETVAVIESNLDLVLNLDNPVSTITADPDGNITGEFEESRLTIFYGGEPVGSDNQNLLIRVDWNGMMGQYLNGVITPTKWHQSNSSDIATVELTVTYEGVTKSIIYTVSRIKAARDGESPVIWSIYPDVSTIKATETTVSRESVTITVFKTIGDTRVIVPDYKFDEEKIKLIYARTFKGTGTEENKRYQNYIPVTPQTQSIEVTLLDKSDDTVILDKTSIPVIVDGTNAYNVILDLTNENSNVIADTEGNLLGEIEETEIKLYKNREEVRLSSLPESAFNVKWNCINGILNTTTGKLYNMQWRDDPVSKNSNSGYAEISVQYAGVVYSKIYSVTKVRQAEDGKSPVIYSINTSASVVRVSGGVLSTPQLKISVNKTTAEKTITLTEGQLSEEQIEVLYKLNNDETYLRYSRYIELSVDDIQIDVAIRKEGTEVLLDRETIPVVRDGSQGDWKDYIFCKSIEKPNIPTFSTHPNSGTLNPGSNQIWWDGPNSDGIWWMSSATIIGSSSTNEVSVGWSDPQRVTATDGLGYECEYTNAKSLVTPPVTSSWAKSPTTPGTGYYTWMRMKSTNDSEWSYIRITGERGSDGNSIIVKGDLKYVGIADPNTISGNNEYEFILVGPSAYTEGATEYTGKIYKGSSPIAGVLNGDCYLYEGKFFMCTGKQGDYNTFTVTSVKGDPGDSWKMYVAYSVDNERNTPYSETWSAGMGWIGIAVLKTTEYPEFPSNQDKALFTWSKFTGQDAYGQEFIFLVTKDNFNPTTAGYKVQEINTSAGAGESQNGKSFQDDEFLPATKYGYDLNHLWTDDPKEVSEEYPIQWVSHRKKSSEGWGQFSTPIIWNRFAKDGIGITVQPQAITKIAKEAGEQNENYILIPNSYSNYTEGDTEVVGTLYIQGSQQLNVPNGNTYVYGGNYVTCTGKTGNYNSWKIVQFKGDPGEASYMHVMYSTDDQGSSTSSTWSIGYNYVGIWVDNLQESETPLDIRWINFKGIDGYGQEFIFIRTETDWNGLSPENKTRLESIHSISRNSSKEYSGNSPKVPFQNDEFLPKSESYGYINFLNAYIPWTDDPQEVNEEYPYQWVSQRKKVNGSWEEFSNPVLWNKYAKDGTGIKTKGVLNQVGQGDVDSNNTFQLITSSVVNLGITTEITGSLYSRGVEVIDVANGDCYSYNGYFFICAGESGNSSWRYSWTIMAAKGDPGTSSYLIIRYKNSTTNVITKTFTEGDDYIGFAVSTEPDNDDNNPQGLDFSWSKFVGQDGAGIEFIYLLTGNDYDPQNPQTNMDIPSNIDKNSGTSYSNNNDKTFQTDEFLPRTSPPSPGNVGYGYRKTDGTYTDWTDDPQDTSIELPKQWMSQRKKVNGVWSEFSVPVIFNEFQKDAYYFNVESSTIVLKPGGRKSNREVFDVIEDDHIIGGNYNSISDGIESGNCSGTKVTYMCGTTALSGQEFSLTIRTDNALQGGQQIYVWIIPYILGSDPGDNPQYFYTGTQLDHQHGNVVTIPSSELFNGAWVNTDVKNAYTDFFVYTKCDNQEIKSWSITLTSAEDVSTVINVTREAFNPSINLGVSSFTFNPDATLSQDPYTPKVGKNFGLTYLSDGENVSYSNFTNAGYNVFARLIDRKNVSDLSDDVKYPWFRADSLSPQDETDIYLYVEDGSGGWCGLLAHTIDGSSGSPYSPSSSDRVRPENATIEIAIVEIGSGQNQFPNNIDADYEDLISSCAVFKRTININPGVGIESVKTYLVNGNAEVRGNITATSGNIGGWTIDEDEISATARKYSSGPGIYVDERKTIRLYSGELDKEDNIISPYIMFTDSRSVSGKARKESFYLDTNGISFGVIDYSGNSVENSYIKSNGSFKLGGGNLTYDPDNNNGQLVVNGNITATSGSIGGWTISSNGIRTSNSNITLNSNNCNLYLGDSSDSIVLTAPATGQDLGIRLLKKVNNTYDTVNITKDSISISTGLTSAQSYINYADTSINSYNINGNSIFKTGSGITTDEELYSKIPTYIGLNRTFGWFAGGSIRWSGYETVFNGSINTESGSIGGWNIDSMGIEKTKNNVSFNSGLGLGNISVSLRTTGFHTETNPSLVFNSTYTTSEEYKKEIVEICDRGILFRDCSIVHGQGTINDLPEYPEVSSYIKSDGFKLGCLKVSDSVEGIKVLYRHEEFSTYTGTIDILLPGGKKAHLSIINGLVIEFEVD